MDGGDLLALCQENLVFEASVPDGISADLLCAFQYWGVPDLVDYANIPWRNARFDTSPSIGASSAANRLFAAWLPRPPSDIDGRRNRMKWR
jgi:hypothetical protein